MAQLGYIAVKNILDAGQLGQSFGFFQPRIAFAQWHDLLPSTPHTSDGQKQSLAHGQTIKKMGSMTDILGMIPGMGALRGKFNPKDIDERQMARVEAIIHSMTQAERQEPSIINGSRRKRIADGSGTSPAQVNQLLSQFKQMQKMMKKLSGPGGKRALMGMLKG